MDIKDLGINTGDLSGELATQASRFMYVCELYVQAMGEYDKGQLSLDKTVSDLDEKIRLEAAEKGVKITEKAIENSIKSDPTYLNIAGSMVHIKVKRDLLKHLKDAWSMRSDSLLKIASMQRDELYMAGKDRVSEKITLDSLGSYS